MQCPYTRSRTTLRTLKVREIILSFLVLRDRIIIVLATTVQTRVQSKRFRCVPSTFCGDASTTSAEITFFIGGSLIVQPIAILQRPPVLSVVRSLLGYFFRCDALLLLASQCLFSVFIACGDVRTLYDRDGHQSQIVSAETDRLVPYQSQRLPNSVFCQPSSVGFPTTVVVSKAASTLCR